MNNFIKLAAIFAATTTLSATAVLADPIVAIGPKVGTQGIGIEGRAPVAENTFVRLGANYFKYNHNYKDDDFANSGAAVKFKGSLTLLTVPLMVDYHPFDNSGFRVSAGIAYNGNKLDLKASPAQNVKINGNTYTPAQVGSIKGKLKLGSTIGGLLTLGYDSSFVGNNPLSFAFEAGVMYSGQPKLSISATGEVGKQTQFISDLRNDANDAIKSVKNYLRFYPIVSLGVKYSF
jgi:hypothetical protein